MNKEIPYKIYLEEDEMPKAWYNVRADMINKPAPLLNPETLKPMTEDEYYVRGGTALLDAVGGAINHIGNVHKYARKEDVPEKTIFVIMTDGYENASRRYDYDEIRRMITRQKKKYGWEFMFLGANIDVISEARKFGVDEEMAVEFLNDKKGTAVSYDAICGAVSNCRTYGAVPPTWKANIDNDRRSRRGK